MNDILKQFLLAWLIHFSWMSVAESSECTPSTPPTIDLLQFKPEQFTEGDSMQMTAFFDRSFISIESVSSEVSGRNIRIVVTTVETVCPDLFVTFSPARFNVDLEKLLAGDYTVEIFHKDKNTGNVNKMISTAFSVSKRIESSAIPSLSQSGIVLLTLLFSLLVMAHRYNYIDFKK